MSRERLRRPVTTTEARSPRWFTARIRRLSLRTRLVAGVLVLAAAGLFATDLATLLFLKAYLETQSDAQLSLIQLRLQGADDGQLPRWVPPPPAQQAFTALTGKSFVETRDNNGALTARVPDEPTVVPTLAPLDVLRGQGELNHPFTLEAPGADGHDQLHYRVLIWIRAHDQGTTTVALDMSDQLATSHHLAIIELAVTLIVLSLIGILAVMVVRVGLRPLDDVENTAEAIIAVGDLSRRVPTQADPDTEIGRLAVTLNTMLRNLQAAFAQRAESQNRLRQFAADASHELRTPTAVIRGSAELYRHGVVQQPEQIGALFARIETEATRMGLLVDDLLLLARLDQNRPRESEPVDLLPVAVDALDAARVIAPTRPLQLEIIPERDESGGAAPIVIGDEAQLRQVTTNLLSNALRHTPPETPITVRVGVPPDQPVALFEVVDRGPGLSPEEAEHAFERFYRADPGRRRRLDHPAENDHSGGAGAGLGLSIVAAIVATHQGTVEHQPTPGGGATFRVTIPLQPS